MARSLWSGSLSFGLVNVPVALVTAVRDQDLHFRQLHEKDDKPIEMRRFCAEEDEEVPWDEIAHAYDLNGKQVVLTDDELASADPERSRTIDIEEFVDLADVDPIYFDHPYFLVPAADNEGTARAYRLLVDVMSHTERAALGRFVMRTKLYLAAIRVRGKALSLTTMRFADEVRPTKGIAAPTSGKAHKPTPKQLEGALSVIEALSTDWDPQKYKDRYRRRLKKVVDEKQKKGTVEVPDAEEDDTSPVPDLMAALEETIAGLSSRSK
jgi:DNA end-binding protein Ku